MYLVGVGTSVAGVFSASWAVEGVPALAGGGLRSCQVWVGFEVLPAQTIPAGLLGALGVLPEPQHTWAGRCFLMGFYRKETPAYYRETGGCL